MTIASTRTRLQWQYYALTKRGVLRMIAAGTAWGFALTAGLTAMTYAQYGMVCSDDLIFIAATSIIGGILAIGPIAAYGRKWASRGKSSQIVW